MNPNAITLTWPPVGGAQSYTLRRSIAGAPYSVIAQLIQGTPIPTVAAAQGYNTLTFGPNPIFSPTYAPGCLVPGGFYGNAPTTTPSQNSDGSLTLNGSAHGTQVATAGHKTGFPNNWTGIAFGGGMYAEAIFKFNPLPGSPIPPWPTWWSNDIETMATGTVTAANQWQGQASNYGNWFEGDFFEADSGSTTTYGTGFINWYATVGSNTKVNTTFAFVPIGALGFAQYNKYGFLWIPATASTPGTLASFLNDVLVKSVNYTLYNPAAPPPPVLGSSAFSVVDSRHIVIMFDTNTSQPFTLQSCSVWQPTMINNLIQ